MVKASGGATAQHRQVRTDNECVTVVEVPSTGPCLCELIRGMVPNGAVTIPLNVPDNTHCQRAATQQGNQGWVGVADMEILIVKWLWKWRHVDVGAVPPLGDMVIWFF